MDKRVSSTQNGREALERAAAHAFAYLDALDTAPVAAPASLADLREALQRPLAQHGIDPAQVIDDLVADTRGGLNVSQGGRFFGWVMGGSLPAAMAADWLTSAWDQNAGLYATSPAASIVEEVAGAWLRDLFGLPEGSSFAFTTGTQMGHVTCLAAARHAVLEHRGYDVERKGLSGAPQIRILVSDDIHISTDRAVRLLGFGSNHVERLAVDESGCVAPETLAMALKERHEPAIVVLQAGELNRAAFDPFARLAPIARAHGAWVHVDGAFGLWARAVPSLAHLAAGIEQCDSWTTDAHKILNVPYDSGVCFIRDAKAHRAALAIATSYLPATGAARDQLDYNPEFSRRARGFAVYAALRQLGRDGVAALVTRQVHNARALAEGIAKLDGAALVAASGLNQALVRFTSTKPGATDADHDARTDEVIAAINASGEAFFGGVTWHGRRCMRISVCNWRTSDIDIERTIGAVRVALAQ